MGLDPLVPTTSSEGTIMSNLTEMTAEEQAAWDSLVITIRNRATIALQLEKAKAFADAHAAAMLESPAMEVSNESAAKYLAKIAPLALLEAAAKRYGLIGIGILYVSWGVLSAAGTVGEGFHYWSHGEEISHAEAEVLAKGAK
jgi:hypothetical protein